MEERTMEETTASRTSKWFTALVIAMVIGMAAQTVAIGYLAFKPGGGTPPSAVEAAESTSGGWHLVNPHATSQPGGTAQIQRDPIIPFNPGQWDPFQEMRQMQDRLDAMFNNALGRMGASPKFSPLMKGFSATPNMDMTENDNEYQIRVDLPGTDESKIDVSLKGQQLTISAERNGETGGKTPGTMLRTERYMGRYERALTLPNPVVEGGLKTHYDKGVLTITVQKKK
jgi:HSP20 family protein